MTIETAWIVGGTRGIGRSTADRLVSKGWRVIVSGTSAGALIEDGSSRWSLHVDTSSSASIVDAVRVIEAAGFSLDAVINCAGDSPGGSVMDLTDSQWDHSVQTKLLGYIRVCRTVLPILERRGGSLVNVIGSAAHVARADYVVGCLNAALVHFTRGLAQEWCAKGVHVLGVNPGPTDTDRLRLVMEATVARSGRRLEDVRAEYTSTMYQPNLLTATAIADVIAMLLDPGARALNGSILLADGGATGGWV